MLVCISPFRFHFIQSRIRRSVASRWIYEISLAPTIRCDQVDSRVSQGQPGWLNPWYNFWIASLTSTPAAFLHGIGLIELTLGLALVIGLLRKTVYLGGIILSLMIWSIMEGFGGPYKSGSTDVGAARMLGLR
jgi:hypothetical protein